MNYHRFILKNGLRVILVPIHEVRSATTLVMVGAGSRYEDKNNNGVSHFLEHMAFKGTTKRPTAMQIASLIDGIGAESNAFTGKELTGYYIKSSSNHVDLALDMLSDLLRNSLLEVREIDRERGVILEEINLYEDTPMRKIGDIFERLLYGDTPMGWDIAGEKEIIKKLKRGVFTSYMKRFYSAHNMTLVVAGNIDMEKVKDGVARYFSPLSKFSVARFQNTKELQKKPEVFIKHKKTEQVHFALGFRTVGLPNEKDRYPLSVLSALLGGGMSSRLFHEIREKRGLAYYVRAVSEHYADSGYLACFAGVDAKRVDEAITVVMSEFEKVRKDGKIKEVEVKKAKQYLKGHFVLDLEDTKSVASFYGSSELLEKKIESPEEVIEKIMKVTLDDIDRVAKKYIRREHLNLALIGNFENQDRFKKLLE